MKLTLKIKLNATTKNNKIYEVINKQELETWRLKNLLSQKECAEKLGITERIMTYLRTREKSYIKRQTLKKIKEKGLVEVEFVE